MVVQSLQRYVLIHVGKNNGTWLFIIVSRFLESFTPLRNFAFSPCTGTLPQAVVENVSTVTSSLSFPAGSPSLLFGSIKRHLALISMAAFRASNSYPCSLNTYCSSQGENLLEMLINQLCMGEREYCVKEDAGHKSNGYNGDREMMFGDQVERDNHLKSLVRLSSNEFRKDQVL